MRAIFSFGSIGVAMVSSSFFSPLARKSKLTGLQYLMGVELYGGITIKRVWPVLKLQLTPP